MFEKFTEGAIKVIMLAQEEARRMGHNFVGTEQLLLGVLGQRHGIAGRALAQVNVTLKRTRKEIERYIGRGTGFVASEIPFTPRAKRVLEMSIHESQDLGVNYVGTEHLLLSLMNETDGVALRTLEKLGVNIPKLRHLTFTYIEEQQEDILRTPLTDEEKWAIASQTSKGNKNPALREYTVNVTEDARENRLDPVIGRDEEISYLIKILGRRRKNNPVLLGEAGVGKTACAEGLAQEMLAADTCPEFLEGHEVRSLDLGAVLAGTKYRGEFEERMKRILDEIKENGKIVLVIDEVHTLVGAGAAEGAVDAANLLKPALARGKLRCIGATTSDEYRKYIEKDPALERRFCPIMVEEPTIETTKKILYGLRPEFERHHAVGFTADSLEQAVELSARFIADRNLPDKAIDVIDEAASRVRLQNRKLPKGLQKLMLELHETLKDKEDAIRFSQFRELQDLVEHEIEVRTHIRIMQFAMANRDRFKTHLDRKITDLDKVHDQDVAKVVSIWTGIPLTKLQESEQKRLLRMEDELHGRLIGQHQATVAVSKAIRRARVGLGDPKRPIASFIFAGPTGVGKTELTKALADFMFNNEESMIRFDMSEYMERHTVAKLIGSPPGYVGHNDGGQLTEAIRKKPYSILLFDEVEKAHPDIFNLFLQILDDGHLTDSSGRVVTFKNSIIIMTTNIGSRVIESMSPILRAKSKKPTLYNIPERTEKIRVDISVKSDGTLSIKPPVEPEVTPDDNEVFAEITKLVREELKKFFRPEFLNRVDDIIVFNHLTKYDVWKICALMVKSVEDRLSQRKVQLQVDDTVRYFLTEKGYDPEYGARPLRRAVTKYLEDRLADACLKNPIVEGTIISVTQETKPVANSGIQYSEEFDKLFSENFIIKFDYSQVPEKEQSKLKVKN
jgi:ATP-dependent Clp protease ATP-binding subunit ClpC